jgi:FkbM family methyltransferase
MLRGKKTHHMTIKKIIKGLFALIRNRFSQQSQDKMEDFLFVYLPIKVIKYLYNPCAGYLACYSPKAGDIVIDIGAWRGNISIVLSRMVGPHGLVIAIEPQEISCDKLKKRLKKLCIKNVKVLNCACYSSDITKNYLVGNQADFSIIWQEELKNKDDKDVERIILKKLDTIIDELELKKVDYIKMDIEGAEVDALLGASGIINYHKPHFAIASYHYVDGKRTDYQVEQILRDYGYAVSTVNPAHRTTCGFRKINLKTN